MLFIAAYSTLVLWVWFICWHISLILIRVNKDPHSQVAQPKEIVCNISRALPLSTTEALSEQKVKHSKSSGL